MAAVGAMSVLPRPLLAALGGCGVLSSRPWGAAGSASRPWGAVGSAPRPWAARLRLWPWHRLLAARDSGVGAVGAGLARNVFFFSLFREQKKTL
jgi:hypothetical protein